MYPEVCGAAPDVEAVLKPAGAAMLRTASSIHRLAVHCDSFQACVPSFMLSSDRYRQTWKACLKY